MAKRPNPNNPNTTISISKSIKTNYLDRFRKKEPKRKGYENDNKTLKWILEQFTRDHPELLHDPQTTY